LISFFKSVVGSDCLTPANLLGFLLLPGLLLGGELKVTLFLGLADLVSGLSFYGLLPRLGGFYPDTYC
jgi:hypothetical protein